MKYFFYYILISSILLLSVEAFDGKLKFKNSDNSTFEADLFGDEWFSWMENQNKDIIIYNSSSKNYEYAQLDTKSAKVELVATGIKATSENTIFLNKLTYRKFQIDRKYLIDIWKRKKQENEDIYSK